MVKRWMAPLAALAGLLALAAPASAWWNADWTYRKAVTVDTSPSGVNVSGPVGRMPVLVRLHDGNFTFGDVLPNGADIRFVDSDDKTPLPYHIESFDAATGVATVWVSVPNIQGGAKRQLWLYFGNEAAPAASAPRESFDADQQFAFHFAEGPGQAAQDSTAYGNHAAGPVPAVAEGGIIGRSARFAGTAALTIPETPSLAQPAGQPLTFSAWVKPAALTGQQALFQRGDFELGLDAGVPVVRIGAASSSGSAAIAADRWTHLAVVADGQAIRLYADGVEVATAAAALPALAGPAAIGAGFTGDLDEARLSRTARPAAMLLAMAQSEGQASKLVAVSEGAERAEAGGSPFFFVLSKVHTIDAFIIGLCLLLLALAIAVMVTKARYLSAADQANAAFMKRFAQMRDELLPLDRIPGLSAAEKNYLMTSPVARLYEAGIEEREVLSSLSGGNPLSNEGIEAMRSAIDAQMVLENQKLDKWMVILTIAISGGPFLGLLGTVIGVMNTFAGVAIAGDVNVNAIAPGIAAALMATIAGLACAIPALFGYNWLNLRISALADRMRVFADRMVTQFAEMQSRNTPPPMKMAAE
jgi:biopolymer transport protein ExbB